MNGEELLSYFEGHCQTERALFHVSHIYALYDMAREERPRLSDGFYSVYVDVSGPLVEKARRFLKEENEIKDIVE